MKLLTKLSLVAAALAAFGTSAAFADNQQLQNQLALNRAQNAPRAQQTTVAIYTGQRGLGRSEMSAPQQPAESRFELRSNAHGQTYGVYVPVK
jgi:hypothetical protein